MNTAQKCLFGGALVAAGIAVQANNADASFVNVTGDSYAYAYAYQDTNYVITNFLGDGSGSAVSTSGNAEVSVSMSVGANEIRTETTAVDLGGYYGLQYSYGGIESTFSFEVTQTTQLLLSWDVSRMELGNGSENPLTISIGPFVSIFSDDLASTKTGSFEFTASAGTTYDVEFDVFRNSTALLTEGTSFVSLSVVPAPGAAGLLAVAGLAATRRRR